MRPTAVQLGVLVLLIAALVLPAGAEVPGGTAWSVEVRSEPAWADEDARSDDREIARVAQAASSTGLPRDARSTPSVTARETPRRAADRAPLDDLSTEEMVRRYCEVTATTAERTRLEKDRRELAAAATEMEKRIEALRAATAQHKEWLDRRTSFQAQAQESLVRIYSRMKPEAAAAHMGEMDPLVAAAMLARMDAKIAGAILAEVEPSRAGRIAGVVAGAAELEVPANRHAAGEGGR